MKKILLATTILAASAGAAAAEVTFGGSAEMGIADFGGGWEDYAGVSLDVTFSGTTDGGLTFGATTSIASGDMFDSLDDGFSSGDGELGNPEVFISGNFGRLAMSHNGYSEFQADACDCMDVDYSGTFGALSVGLRADVEGNQTSVTAGYSAGAVSVTLNADDTGAWGLSGSYAMGQVTVGASVDDTNATSVSVDYDNGAGITAGIEVNDDSTWEANFGYAANGMSVNATFDDASAWEVTGSYDLGGGLSVEGGTDNDGDMFVGAAMTF